VTEFVPLDDEILQDEQWTQNV